MSTYDYDNIKNCIIPSTCEDNGFHMITTDLVKKAINNGLSDELDRVYEFWLNDPDIISGSACAPVYSAGRGGSEYHSVVDEHIFRPLLYFPYFDFSKNKIGDEMYYCNSLFYYLGNNLVLSNMYCYLPFNENGNPTVGDMIINKQISMIKNLKEDLKPFVVVSGQWWKYFRNKDIAIEFIKKASENVLLINSVTGQCIEIAK